MLTAAQATTFRPCLGRRHSRRWHADARVLAWSFPGLTAAVLDDASLSEIGRWPFEPDMAWLKMQAFAFEYFHSRLRASADASYKKGWLERIASQASATVYAQDGCTGLHWLDGSIYRPCCDQQNQDILYVLIPSEDPVCPTFFLVALCIALCWVSSRLAPSRQCSSRARHFRQWHRPIILAGSSTQAMACWRSWRASRSLRPLARFCGRPQ